MGSPTEFSGRPIYVCVQHGEVVVADTEVGVELPAAPPTAGIQHVLGSLGNRACVAVDLDEWNLDAAHVDGRPVTGPLRRSGPPLREIGLRELHGLVGEETWGVASRAVQVVAWDRHHRFCGRCGSRTEPQPCERVRRCPSCGLSAYPRLTPAIIVLVTRGQRGQQALLAWARRRVAPFYSLVAGFVEPGEDLEEAVAREVREETAIEVTDIHYAGSQPWPFPSQLMVGFRARYAGGEIEVQESEIVQARWFTAEEAERVSTSRGGFSIAGQLLDDWLAEQRGLVSD